MNAELQEPRAQLYDEQTRHIMMLVHQYDYPPKRDDSFEYTEHRALERYHNDARFQNVVRRLVELSFKPIEKAMAGPPAAAHSSKPASS